MSNLILPRRRLLAAAIAPLGAAIVSRVPDAIAGPAPRAANDEALATTASSYCPVGEELTFLTLINNYRAANGLGPLAISRTLGAAAEHHSQDMARYNYFSHTLASGTSWSSNIRKHGYSGTAIAENIAAGYSRASSTFNQWKNSAGHNRNMLNAAYTAIGIGRASRSGTTYTYYWTTTFGNTFDAGPLC